MKTLKTIDYAVQLVFMVIAVVVISTFSLRFEGPGLTMYFFVGGWQVLSVLAHLLVDAQYKIPLRNVYLYILCIVIIAGLVSLLTDFIIEYLIGLIFLSPAMAILYVVCCIRETNRITTEGQEDQRPPA
jgi:hypothetical protein